MVTTPSLGRNLLDRRAQNNHACVFRRARTLVASRVHARTTRACWSGPGATVSPFAGPLVISQQFTNPFAGCGLRDALTLRIHIRRFGALTQ